MSSRRIEALRNLAERPGTKSEGIVAREMLKRAEAKAPSVQMGGLIPSLRDLLQRYDIPDLVMCPCGVSRPIFDGPCPDTWSHMEIQTRIRAMFKRGDRVFYNYWAYPPNCPGKITAHLNLQRDNGTYPWAWISVKFDHLKNARRIPVLNDKGEWCLTKEPQSTETQS